MNPKRMHFDKRQVFIVDNKRGNFYPVQDIIIDMLKHWNQEFIAQLYRNENDPTDPLYDLNDEEDWRYAGERLAAEMGADVVVITDDARDLIKVFDRSKWRGAK